MKILTGKYAGRNFFMPEGIRPTQNIPRKAIFDILGHALQGQLFLDLYAGSGAVGIEALSLGAAEVIFVEHNPQCCDVIRDNLIKLKPAESGQRVKILQMGSFAAIKQFAKEERRFDVVFFDPPFDVKLGKKTLKTLLTHDILQPNSIVVAQYGLDEKMPDVEAPWTLYKHKRYGASNLTIYQKAE